MKNFFREFYTDSKFLNFFRYQMTPYMIRKRSSKLLFDDSRFYRLNLNCRGDAYYGYVNIEDTRTKARVFVSRLDKLPFSDKEVKFIIADFQAIDKKKYNYSKMYKEWARVMVPNAILTLDNFQANELEVKMLKEADFELIFDDSKKLLPVAHFLYNPEIGADGRLGLEYMRPKQAFDFLVRLRDELSLDLTREILVKNEALEENGRLLSFFDKANFAQILDGIGFFVDDIGTENGRIKVRVSKKIKIGVPGLKIERKKKICALEQYLMFRYNHLGFDEDGLPLAIEKLGYDCLPIEGMRNMDHKVLQQAILEYKPDYLIFRLKEVMPVLFDIKRDLKRLGTKVMFWFTDPTHPEFNMDLSDVIDIMFLSNRGQLEEYKKAYSLNRVYFMAQSYMPNVFHHIDRPQIYDVGFTGALSKDPLHSTRRRILERLNQKYQVKIRNNVRNNVAEFYSDSKLVFGTSNFPYDCYTSNRFFIAMGCGAVYLTRKFPGIERFVRNKEHVLWFDTDEEMADLVEFYIKNDAERRKIGVNAQKLAEDKHTCVHRVQNMIDILEGKTERFYGFLKE
jgi:hypothetical protein